MDRYRGNILSPRDGEYVGSEIVIKGLLSSLPPEKDVWIVHRRIRNGAYWPKEPQITQKHNHHFEVKVYEGGASGKVVISLIMVDKSVSSIFQNWLESGHATGDYPGIDPNEYCVEELTNVEVIYKKDRPLTIFYSYAHKDEELRESLEKHLSLLKRTGYVEYWHDRCLTAGTDFSKKISSELENANIILLLVSSNFLASDYCCQIEMKKALERHEKQEARVIPIIIKPADWSGAPFGHLLSLPKDGYPVTLWTNQDEAWTDVAKGIRAVIEEMR